MASIKYSFMARWLILALLVTLPNIPSISAGNPCSHDVAPVAQPPCYGIGPGAAMHALDWTDCTASFLARNESSVFIWTAGHCTEEVGQPVWFRFPEPGYGSDYEDMHQRDPDGIVVYRPGEPGDNRVPPHLDYTLIELNRTVWKWLRPEMPVWSGPEGVFSDWDRDPATVYHYGHFFGIEGTPAEARSGVGPMSHVNETFTISMAGGNGDSGGPVVAESGAAMGIVVWQVLPPDLVPGDGHIVAVRLDYAMEQARRDAGLNLTLVEDLSDLPDVQPLEPEDEGTGVHSPGGEVESPSLPTLGLVLSLVLAVAARVGRRDGRRP